MFSNSAGTVPTCSTALKSSDEGRNGPTLHEVGIKSRNKAHKVKSAVLFTEDHPFRESAEIPSSYPDLFVLQIDRDRQPVVSDLVEFGIQPARFIVIILNGNLNVSSI